MQNVCTCFSVQHLCHINNSLIPGAFDVIHKYLHIYRYTLFKFSHKEFDTRQTDFSYICNDWSFYGTQNRSSSFSTLCNHSDVCYLMIVTSSQYLICKQTKTKIVTEYLRLFSIKFDLILLKKEKNSTQRQLCTFIHP